MIKTFSLWLMNNLLAKIDFLEFRIIFVQLVDAFMALIVCTEGVTLTH